MTSDVILSKLDHLTRTLNRLESRQYLTLQELESNLDQQDIVMLNLERLVQISVDMSVFLCSRRLQKTPQSAGDSFQILHQAGIIEIDLLESMRKAVGFRNLAVHEYSKIDFQKVHEILQQKLPDFKRFAEQIYRYNCQEN